MALPDRLGPLCDLLLGAAHADAELKDREIEEVQGLLEDLNGGALPPELAKRISSFAPKTFDLARTAAAFNNDPVDDRKRVLYLVAAINEADDEIDFAEDDYLRALCKALALPDDALAGLALDVEVLRADFDKVKKGPPPPPGAVNVDVK
jgi:uncharacterized membrane protein YebE (DUF533 family)